MKFPKEQKKNKSIQTNIHIKKRRNHKNATTTSTRNEIRIFFSFLFFISHDVARKWDCA